MCFSFCCEAAGMVASMATLKNRFVSRSKVRCLFAAEHRSNFACRFCFFAKTQQNYGSLLWNALDAKRFSYRHYSKPHSVAYPREKQTGDNSPDKAWLS